MHRNLLIALAVLAVGGAVAAYALGRSARVEPRAPDSRAEAIKVEEIDAKRWKLADVDLPRLAPPDPTAVPTATSPGTTATSVPTTPTTPTTPSTPTTPTSPGPISTTAPPPPTPVPTAVAPDPTSAITGGIGGDP